jgi:hypothetical protein
MRQIFSSPRLENVETVDQLLNAAGIDTRLTNARSWNRATKRDFSYSDQSGTYKWPAVWVLKADDYVRARQLLRESGVALPTTRNIEAPSYTVAPAAASKVRTPSSIATRLRYVLLAGVLVAAGVYALRAMGIL